MWQTKYFTTQAKRDNWINKNSKKYLIDIIFVNNGFAIEYKKLRVIDIK